MSERSEVTFKLRAIADGYDCFPWRGEEMAGFAGRILNLLGGSEEAEAPGDRVAEVVAAEKQTVDLLNREAQETGSCPRCLRLWRDAHGGYDEARPETVRAIVNEIDAEIEALSLRGAEDDPLPDDVCPTCELWINTPGPGWKTPECTCTTTEEE